MSSRSGTALKLDLPFYNREQLAAAAGVSLETVKRRLRDGDLDYDAEIVGRDCFSREAAIRYVDYEARRRRARSTLGNAAAREVKP